SNARPPWLSPERLAAWLEDWDGSIVRAKGVCYVAAHGDVIGVSQAGPSVQAGPIGEWRPEDDRRTRLVIIGRSMNEGEIRKDLEACVIDSDERELAASVTDPFPLSDAS
ncbi:MAG: GTP-binding protein, partial [Natrinema limicola]